MRRENKRPSRGMCSAIEHADGQRSDQAARSPAAEIGIEPGLQSLPVEEDAVGINGEVIDRGFGRVIVELFADPSRRTRRQGPPPNILCGQGYLQVAVVLVFFLRTPQGLNARCGANATTLERLSGHQGAHCWAMRGRCQRVVTALDFMVDGNVRCG